MARPNRQGVDYFPLDVYLDDKFKFIEIKYKLEGFAIVVKLLQKIYSYGYWYKWSDDEALLFADEIRADLDLVRNVVNECIERDIFHKELYEAYGILTSKGIQKRYKEIVRRRKDVDIIEEYLLIDDIMTSLSNQNDVKSTQSKVKESKVNRKEKEKKVKESKINCAEFVQMTEAEHDTLIEKYGEHLVRAMIEKLDNYKGSTGKKYKSDYRTILSWVAEQVVKENITQGQEQSRAPTGSADPKIPRAFSSLKQWENMKGEIKGETG